MLEILIKEKFPSLNQYTNANRGNAYKGAKLKKKYTDVVYKEALAAHKGKITLKDGVPAFKEPVFDKVDISFVWYEKNQRRDKDNIAFNKKFILDGLVKANVIEKDGWKNVDGFKDEFELADFYGVKVSIREVEE